jgi:hypothetical protein
MIAVFRYDHLRQQVRTRRALFNRLRRLTSENLYPQYDRDAGGCSGSLA